MLPVMHWNMSCMNAWSTGGNGGSDGSSGSESGGSNESIEIIEDGSITISGMVFYYMDRDGLFTFQDTTQQ